MRYIAELPIDIQKTIERVVTNYLKAEDCYTIENITDVMDDTIENLSNLCENKDFIKPYKSLMKQINKIKDLKVIASKPIFNSASINIHEIDGCDRVLCSVNNIKPRWHKLYSTYKGEYFNFGGCRYYLHEFMRA